MNKILIYSKISSDLLYIKSDKKIENYRILDCKNECVDLEVLRHNDVEIILDASMLEKWSINNPVCYTLETDDQKITFGHSEISTFGNSQILLNGEVQFLRGYIRGIIAHDHPNLLGLDELEFYRKNIKQAKKFGFNLVRFHSTIPSPLFVQAADELGLLIHMEIGFAYEYDSQGNKKSLSLDNKEWNETILKYRNSPSVAIFCIGNEMHNSGKVPEVKELYKIGKGLAPNKLIMDNSGWGEYDRSTADIYSQHIAYYFPFKAHENMFKEDFCWHLNGSIYNVPMSGENFYRNATALRPVIAHEAMHYIDIIDYKKLLDKFEKECKIDVKYPRFLTEIPKLLERKKLLDKYPKYILASQKFKKFAMKTYIERLRLSNLCGFEMLQFADCLKYENRNGIVDCFDDDRFIEASWFNKINGDTVLLADYENESFFANNKVAVKLYLSHFGSIANICGDLKVKLNGKLMFTFEKITTVNGLQKLADIEFNIEVGKNILEVEFSSDILNIANEWNLWGFENVEEFSNSKNVVVCETLDDKLLNELESGNTVLLHYHRDKKDNQYYIPGSLDRFKPCIWDRGNNLGGFINEKWLEDTLFEEYFDANMYPLIEGAYKINLDHFPIKVNELISGVDKPVRDRMKGLVDNIKDFIDDDTLRNFCYLLAFKVGNGKLVISTFNKNNSPISQNYEASLLKNIDNIKADNSISIVDFKNYLTNSTNAGIIKEDVMNKFWEEDNLPVETSLFWETTGIDLAKLK